MIEHHCKFTKNHWIVHLKQANSWCVKLYFFSMNRPCRPSSIHFLCPPLYWLCFLEGHLWFQAVKAINGHLLMFHAWWLTGGFLLLPLQLLYPSVSFAGSSSSSYPLAECLTSLLQRIPLYPSLTSNTTYPNSNLSSSPPNQFPSSTASSMSIIFLSHWGSELFLIYLLPSSCSHQVFPTLPSKTVTYLWANNLNQQFTWEAIQVLSKHITNVQSRMIKVSKLKL